MEGLRAGQGLAEFLWKFGGNQFVRFAQQAGEFIVRHGVSGFQRDPQSAGKIRGGDNVRALGQFGKAFR